LFIAYLTTGSHLHIELKIRPDIRYPAFRLAGYPTKSVSGASLFNTNYLELAGTGMAVTACKSFRNLK
jgi:hypothetical protein